LIAPVGTTIEVELSSVDVEHGLWAPELFGKVDAIPGYVTRLRFTPTQAGTHEYGGQCTQFCGTQHAQMRFSVIAMSRYDFNEWAFQNAKPAAEPTGNAAKGMEVFNAKCIACHTINGNAKAVGKVGPNLTHVASRHFIAGGVLDIDVDNKAAVFAQWLSDPQGVKPGNKMVVQLTDAEVNDLVAYLLTLK
jgi:cytochrome c oxidase subunit 2